MTAISAPGHASTASAPEMLGAHRNISSAVRLAQHDGNFRNGGLAVGMQQLRAVADDAAVFLAESGQEAGNINEGDQRDVEAVADRDKAACFVRGR